MRNEHAGHIVDHAWLLTDTFSSTVIDEIHRASILYTLLFSQNVGFVSMTCVVSRHVVTVGAVFNSVCGLVQKCCSNLKLDCCCIGQR